MKLLTFLFLLSLPVHSQPPIPGKQSPNEQKDTGPKPKQIPAQNEQSTSPVTINQFYSRPSNGVQQESTDEQKHGALFEAIKTGSDILLAIFTFILAAATFLLAAVAYLQWQTMKRHETEFRRMAEHMETSLAETQKATELTRQSVIFAQRPRVIVRFVRLNNEDVVLRWPAS